MGRPIQITVESEALGVPRAALVTVYDTLRGLRCAATKFNHAGDNSETMGVTQLWAYDDDPTNVVPVIRLCRGHLGSRIVSHEVHHAATAIYGAFTQADDPGLTHYNEPFAYLYSDLFAGLVDRLYEIGAYD